MEQKRFTRIIGVCLIIILFFACKDETLAPITTGSITGFVTDAETGNPIAEASISTTPGTSALTTDSTGSYTFLDIPEGGYTVKATKLNYKTASVGITVKAEQTTVANIVMERVESENKAPHPPYDPDPQNGAVDQPRSLDLAWMGSDPDVGDTLIYDVYFGDADALISLVSSDQGDTTYALEDLEYNTTYHWQIIAKDSEGMIANSPVWSFITEPYPQHRIVFASNRSNNFEIYSSSNDGEDQIQLTSEPSRDWWPRISPNRDVIAFSSDRDVESHIYLMNMDGSDVKRITSLPISGFHNYGVGFCWSPDGHRLLYGYFDKLYAIDDDGSNLTEIAQDSAGRHFIECDWSPLGDKIVALTIGDNFYESEIALMDIDGSNRTVLVGDSAGAMGSPSFAPDGRQIVFARDVSGHEIASGRQLDSRIFTFHFDSTRAVDISIDKVPGTNDLNPVWSPDGAKVIFSNVPNDISVSHDIWIMDINGENREKIITGGRMPDWQ